MSTDYLSGAARRRRKGRGNRGGSRLPIPLPNFGGFNFNTQSDFGIKNIPYDPSTPQSPPVNMPYRPGTNSAEPQNMPFIRPQGPSAFNVIPAMTKIQQMRGGGQPQQQPSPQTRSLMDAIMRRLRGR